MRASLFCALSILSVIAVNEGKAAGTEDVKCNYYDGWYPLTAGILKGISSDTTIAQLRKNCQAFPKCTNSSQKPDCVPEVIHQSSTNKNAKKH